MNSFRLLRTATSIAVLGSILFLQRASADPPTDPSQVTWKFFEACSSGNFNEAWETTAPILQARKDISILRQASEKLELKTSTLWSWTVQYSQGSGAIVQGKGSHSDGTYSVVKVTLVWSKGEYRVYSIEVTSLKAKSPDEKPAPFMLIGPCESLADVSDFPLPSKSAIIEKSQRLLDALISIMKDPRFEQGYAKAVRIRPRIPQRPDYELIYRLRDNNVDPNSAPRSEWQASVPSEIDSACLLRAETYCDIGPLRIHIDQSLALATEGWTPIKLEFTASPTPDELKRLTRIVVADFNEAIRSRSFEDFYKTISRRWRTEITVQELEGAYRPFLEKKLELPISDETPITLISEAKNITSTITQFSGYFDVSKNRAWFDFKLVYEPPDWKLFGAGFTLRSPKSEPPDSSTKNSSKTR
jgi:hypothetical protein